MPPPTKLAAGVTGVVHIVVRAESEDDQQYEWRETLAITDKVSKVAIDWATAHGVPSSSVGFDDMNNMEVPLTETPADLGWMAGQEVELKAYPTEDRYMEQAGEQGAVPDDAAEGENAASEGQGAEEAVNASEQAPAAAAAASAQLEAAASPANQAERPKAATAPAAASSSSKPEAKPAPRAKATAAKSSARGAAASPASVAVAAAADTGGVPEDSEDILFEQANPKREGSGAFERYEKYKRARSVSEALRLGAVKGDVAHDYKKGFLKRRRSS